MLRRYVSVITWSDFSVTVEHRGTRGKEENGFDCLIDTHISSHHSAFSVILIA